MKNVQERKESNGKETGIGHPQFLFCVFVLTNTQKWKSYSALYFCLHVTRIRKQGRPRNDYRSCYITCADAINGLHSNNTNIVGNSVCLLYCDATATFTL